MSEEYEFSIKKILPATAAAVSLCVSVGASAQVELVSWIQTQVMTERSYYLGFWHMSGDGLTLSHIMVLPF